MLGCVGLPATVSAPMKQLLTRGDMPTHHSESEARMRLFQFIFLFVVFRVENVLGALIYSFLDLYSLRSRPMIQHRTIRISMSNPFFHMSPRPLLARWSTLILTCPIGIARTRLLIYSNISIRNSNCL